MASIKELRFKHYFRVFDGKIIFEDKGMLDLIKSKLEGKRAYMIIDQDKDKVSSNQYAFYFAGIIRKECMNSNVFKGLSEWEIHKILFSELRSYTASYAKADGTAMHKSITDNFEKYTISDMAEYLEELIAYLATEYGIYVKSKEQYSDTNKYIGNTKVYKAIKQNGNNWK